MLVHLESYEILLSYLFFEVVLKDSQVTGLPANGLSSDWMVYPAPPSTKAVGDAWLASGTSVALRVPSVIVPDESNYLLNPRHPDFNALDFRPPSPFAFDPRLA
jgi:RES domain-containing protein